MPPKVDNAKKNKTVPKQTTLPESTIVIGSGAKLKKLTIPNVVNGSLANPKDCGLNPEYLDPTPFTSSSQNVNSFTLKNYRDFCHVDTVVAYLSKSKEHRDEIDGKNIHFQTSKTHYLLAIKDLNDSNVKEIVSFNKAMAIMSAGVLKHTFEYEFDWGTKKYVKTEVGTKVKPNTLVINRLAGQMGMNPGNPYYWMIVPGYEFLYELYPAEVLALTLVRLNYRKTLNIPDRLTDTDIVGSLVMKMNRLHKLDSIDFDDAIATIGMDNVSTAYVELARDIGTTSKMKRNDEAVVKFKELIKSFEPALEADKLTSIGE